MSPTFLILKPSSLGDILHALPAVHALASLRGAQVDWLIQPAFAEITEYLPELRRNILFERKKLGRINSFPAAFRSLWHNVRYENHYDAVIDLQGLTRSASIGRLARSAVHAGPDVSKEILASLFYSRKLHCPPDIHALEKINTMIAEFAGPDADQLDFHFDMKPVPRFRDAVNTLFHTHEIPLPTPDAPVISFAPGARWPTKQWPPEFFAAVINGLAKRFPDARFVALGAPAEQDAAAETARRASGIRIDNLCGKTSPGGLVEAIRRSSLLLCNDSGPMHIAAALGVPVLALFGPTSPVLTGPYSKKSAVLQPDLACILCLKRYCVNHSNLCHSSIHPEDAVRAAIRLLTGDPL